MNIYNFFKHQRQLSEIMSSDSGMSRWFYIRLMIMSVVEILATIPLGSWIMATAIKAGLGPWVSWANVHSDYSYIYKIPSTKWRRNWADSPDVYRWLVVLCAFTFFTFFGFADEARNNYRCMYRWLVSLFGYSTSSGIFSGRSHTYVDQHSGFDCWAHVFPAPLHLT
jgi:pheromone a factor receptor